MAAEVLRGLDPCCIILHILSSSRERWSATPAPIPTMNERSSAIQNCCLKSFRKGALYRNRILSMWNVFAQL